MRFGAIRKGGWRGLAAAVVGVLALASLPVIGGQAAAATPPTLALRVLLVGGPGGSADPTTGAWAAALSNEGVAFTEVDAVGTTYGSETVALPTLSSSPTSGNYNGVVIADSPVAFASGQLDGLFAYESSFGVRQVDGYTAPYFGETIISGGALDGTTGQLTAAGLTALPGLKGPVPFDTGSYGYPASVNTGAPFTAWLDNSSGQVLAGVYQHPSTDPQAGVSELELNFDYSSTMLQWLLMAPGLIDWVTTHTHLGLYRNYLGQDIDDLFIADNEWSSTYQCTPGATEPPDYTCPAGVANNPADTPPDVQMTPADVTAVVNWEKQNGLTLNLAFNGVGACTAPSDTQESTANCAGSTTVNGTTYTDPGVTVDPTAPDDAAFVNALLANQASFNWITHTWSHLFLGCTVWQPQVLTSLVAKPSGGTFTSGNYTYEITAATAYGESEPSTSPSPTVVTVGTNGSVTLTWPEATNGIGTGGTPGPTLAQEEAAHVGGTGFWGYNIYRENPGSSVFGLVGQVAENPAATAATTYTFTDTGVPPGEVPGSSDTFPTATNPGIDCATPAGSWLPATSANPDSSIEQEIGLDDAFAANNGLTHFSTGTVVTGEHSGIENPNMPAALAGAGIHVFAADASRQPTQLTYTSGGSTALSAPRYPSNIYYNASTWADELNEYNTLYVAEGDPLGTGNETGHCTDTSSTTCRSTPATEADLLASESRIELGHVLDNDPRVGYAHQSNLIGPDYTLLTFLSNVLAQYNTWESANAPFVQTDDVSESQVLSEQSSWNNVRAAGDVTATETNGTVTVTNKGANTVDVPVTVPPGTTVNGAAFGTPYGGQLSSWMPLAGGGSTVLTENVSPTVTSSSTATSIVGAPFSFTVTTAGSPAPSLTETGALPAGITFVDNGNGTATIAGTAQAGSGGSYPLTITGTSVVGSASQSFTLTNDEAPTITSPATASFTTTVSGTYTVTTTGYPAPTISESGTLPAGLTFNAATGAATISGAPATGTAGTYPVSISATNASGSTSTLGLTITVNDAAAPTLTSGTTADFTLNTAGAFAISASGSPSPTISETGALPAGLTMGTTTNGTALISGTPTATGTSTLNITAANGIAPNATQSLTVVVGQAPAFTSANSTTGTVNTPFTFTASAGGYPAPVWGWSNLPPGVTFTDNGDGTATLSGTPTTAGTYVVPLVATNPDGYGSVQQSLTVTIQQGPARTSSNSATFTEGTKGTFSVTTTGTPTAVIGETGALPSGVTFVDNHDGTATLSGTPAGGSNGSYPITVTATNGVGPAATQSFVLTVNSAPLPPAITSASSATFTEGTQGSFSVTTTGNPTAVIGETGALPSGVTLLDNHDGTATLSGTPAAGSSGSYPFTITATNGVSPAASQTFTLTVNPATAAPKITSPNTTTFAAGTAGTFSVTASGTPTPVLSATSSPALPTGVTFQDNGNGTATLAGTPPAGSQGTYTLTVTAKNSTGTDTQIFTLIVSSGLAITSATTATATAGKAFAFTVTTTGTPTPTLTHTGSLPPGVTFTANTNGTATLAGTPTAAAKGPYALTFTANNSTGTTSRAFTLTVDNVPTFTSPAAVTETAGTAFGFTSITTAYPTATLTAGTLPPGVSFSDNGNGTAGLTGTATVNAGTYTFTITATNAVGQAAQTITLTVKAAGTQVAVPAFTSPAAATASSGQAFSFTVTTNGSPTSYTTNVTHYGALPAGVSFDNLGNGTATLSGTPTAASTGTYPLTFTAKDSAGTTTQSFVLTVTGPPAITSAAGATATDGSAFNFTVKTTGAPAPALSESGALPQGLTWTDNGNGSATLSGTPGVAQGGVYKLTLTATNSGGTATQSFTLTVDQAPSITSASSVTVPHGKAMAAFTFTSTGYPIATVSHTGTVSGLTFTANSNGTATLSGTPRTAGTYTLTITAKNSVGTAIQAFKLVVT